MEGMRHGYLLEFVPAVIDNRHHKLAVRVNRPGVTVVFPAGYGPGVR
jgi:hypothetical protein